MKALSFLGTGSYKPTTYVWQKNGKECSYTTRLFPEAVAQIFRPEKLLVLVTPQSMSAPGGIGVAAQLAHSLYR